MSNKIMKINHYYFILVWLMTYFSSKMLWDKIPYVFEITSLCILEYGMLKFILKRKYNVKELRLLFLFCIFSLYIFVQGSIYGDTQRLLRGIYEYVIYMSFFFGCIYYVSHISKPNLQKVFQVLGMLGLVIAGLSWIEFLTKSYLLPREQIRTIIYGDYIGFRASVFTRSYLSHGVILGVFALINYYNYLKKINKKYLLISIFCFISILTTSSRGPLVATIGAWVIMYYIANETNKYNVPTILRALILVIGLAIGIQVIINVDIHTSNQNFNYFYLRIQKIFDWNGDAGNVGRIELWTSAFEWWKKNIWFGIGVSSTGSWGEGTIGVTESGLLKRFVETGILGGTLYYLFVGTIISRAVSKIKDSKISGYSEIQLGLACCILILIDDVTLQVTEEIMVTFFFWFFMALIHIISLDKYEKL